MFDGTSPVRTIDLAEHLSRNYGTVKTHLHLAGKQALLKRVDRRGRWLSSARTIRIVPNSHQWKNSRDTPNSVRCAERMRKYSLKTLILLSLILPPIIGVYGPKAYRWLSDLTHRRESVPTIPLNMPPPTRLRSTRHLELEETFEAPRQHLPN